MRPPCAATATRARSSCSRPSSGDLALAAGARQGQPGCLRAPGDPARLPERTSPHPASRDVDGRAAGAFRHRRHSRCRRRSGGTPRAASAATSAASRAGAPLPRRPVRAADSRPARLLGRHRQEPDEQRARQAARGARAAGRPGRAVDSDRRGDQPMNGLEDLLRQALSETPATTLATDPLDELDRRVRRARRRLTIGGSVAAVAVLAAVVVPLTLVNSGNRAGVQIGGHPTPTATSTPTPPTSLTQVRVDGTVHGVATSDLRGHSFAVTESGTDATRQLVELNAKGVTVRRWSVPDSALFVAHREGTLWVWGGGDGGYPDSQVTAIGAGSKAGATLSLGRGQAVRSLAITEGGDAWAVTVDQVVHLRYRDGAVQVVERLPLTGAQRIVVSNEGTLWVQADTRLVELVPGGDPQGTLVDTADVHHWTGTLFAAGSGGSQPENRLWVQDGTRRVAVFDPLVGAHGLVCSPIRLPGRPTAVVEDGIGGVYVALQGGGVAFFDFAAVKKGGPPTAQLSRDQVEAETMATSLDGSLLMQDFGGKLLRWKPPTS